MRVGAQGRVGIDTIVAGAEAIELTADGVALGDRARLTDSRAGPARGSIGRSARVGAGAVVS
jgi:hypothetical protein